MHRSGLVIYMVVYNHFENDSRVRKEAVTLAKAGHAVTIVAVWKPGLMREQKIGDVRVIRLANTPLHIRVLGQQNFDRLKILVYGPSGPNRPLVPGGTPPGGVRSGAGMGSADQVMSGGNISGRSISGGSISGGAGQKQKKKSPWRNLLQFSVSTAKKLVFTCGFYAEAARFFSKQKGRADVFHAHDLNTLYICHRMAKKSGAALVYDSHELFVHRNRPYDPPGWFLGLETWFEKKYIRRADAVITVSRSIAAYLEKVYGIARPWLIMNAPHQVYDNQVQDNQVQDNQVQDNQVQDNEVHGNPVHGSRGEKKYLLRNALHINKNYTILLYAGGITFGRGLDAVIESLAHADNLFFVMMGPGTPQFKAYLTAVAEKENVADRVAFFGPVPYEAVTAYTASADIGIAPIENVCLSYYFCAPNKVFEYIQGGIPVVASNFPDLAHIVEKNRIGLVCDTAEPRAIAAAVEQVLDNYHFHVRRIRKIRHRYCWENEAMKLEQLYQNL